MSDNEKKKSEDLSEKINEALDKAIQKVISEEKARDGFLVVADKDGKIIKIAAKNL